MSQKKMFTKCSVPDCDSRYHKGMYCPKHRSRLRRTGTLEKRVSELEWILSAIRVANHTDCIAWPFARTSGYGVMQFNGRQRHAHRVALIIFSNADPKSLVCRHGPCHNKLCVNPFHLSWGTQKENINDKLRDGTHQRGSACGSAKLDECDVMEMRRLSNCLSHRELSEMFGVSEKHVSSVVTGRTWSWL